MKIAVITQHYVPERCAPAARMSQLAAAWAGRGHEVHVVCAMPNHPDGVLPRLYRGRLYVHERHAPGIEVHRAPLFVAANRGVLPRALSQGSFPLGVVATARRIPRPDLVVTTSPPLLSAPIAALLARLWGVPLVFDVRDLWPGVFRALGVVRNRAVLRVLEGVERALYRASSQVVAVSPAFVEPIRERGGSLPAERVTVIPNGADLSWWSPGPARPEVRSALGADAADTALVLYAGNHGYAQGLEVLLEAALRVQRRVRFVLVGQGSERARLMARAAALGLGAERVGFSPSVPAERLLELYRAADVCVVPLRAVAELERCIPSKLFEIMACGRPVVAALGGVGAQIVADSGGGRVVAPGDADGLAAAIDEIVADPALGARLGAAGRAHVVAHYDRERLAARYLAVLERVASAARL